MASREALPAPARPPGADRAEGGRGRSGVKVTMPPVENDAYAAFLRRAIRALGARAGDDLGALPELAALRDDVDAALARAVTALRGEPHAYSWGEIGAALGVTRQAAQARWPDAGGARRPGGQPGKWR